MHGMVRGFSTMYILTFFGHFLCKHPYYKTDFAKKNQLLQICNFLFKFKKLKLSVSFSCEILNVELQKKR